MADLAEHSQAPAVVSSTMAPSWMPAEKAQKAVDDTVQQRNTSLRWLNTNFYEEWSEVYRNTKCRVAPLMDDSGREIKDRTNVCMPDQFVMVRRGVARLTANPPDLRVRGGLNQDQRDKVGALMYKQWDIGREQKVFRQVVHQAKVFGWSVEKTMWDKVVAVRTFRRQTEKLTRTQLMTHQGAPEDEIKTAVDELGQQLTSTEVASAMAKYGDEIEMDTPTTKYEGPIGSRIFVGDIFPEAGFFTLQQSAFVIESTIRNAAWLKYWTKQTTKNPYTGEETPVIDEKMAQELIDMNGRTIGYQRPMDLRRLMRTAINQSDPYQDTSTLDRFPGKRFLVDERHVRDDEGNIRIDFIGEERVMLGQMWYPWNTDGRYVYTELNLIPDLLGGIGDSTPRITRYLMQLRNSRANQTTDFINNKLLPFMKMRDQADVTDESFIRTAWGRVLKMKNPADLEPGADPTFPGEAWEDQIQYKSEMQQVEPATADMSPGSAANPQAGKYATGLVLQQKATDSVTGDELAQIAAYQQEILELRLWMSQQTMTEDETIEQGRYPKVDAMFKQGWPQAAPPEVSGEDQTQGGDDQGLPAAPVNDGTGAPDGPVAGDAVPQDAQPSRAQSLRGDGGTEATLIISPYDIQEDFEIMPEIGSTLAQDDQFKQASVQTFFQVAAANTDVFNKRKAAEKLAMTIPGITAEDALLPEQPPQPQGPEIRISLSVSAKFEDLPTDLQTAILSGASLPTDGTEKEGELRTVGKMAEAAKAVDTLREPPGEHMRAQQAAENAQNVAAKQKQPVGA